MSYTRKQWWISVLAAIGNTTPTPFLLDYGVAWTELETGTDKNKEGEFADFNLLNTTEPFKADGTRFDATDFNSVGVKRYKSYADGIEANARVIRNGNYPTLAAALEHNDEIALKAPHQGIMHDLSLWSGGANYAYAIAQKAIHPDSLLPDQAFPGDGPTGPPQVIPPGTPPAPVVKPLTVKIGGGEDFKLLLVGDRYTVVLKHSSEEKMKKGGYI